MSIIVAKFGGSSLADAGQLRKTQHILEANPDRRYVVPSAPGKRFSGDEKVTDLLYRFYDEITAGGDGAETFDDIAGRYIATRDELGLSILIEEELDAVYVAVKNGASRDFTASRGEYLNA